MTVFHNDVNHPNNLQHMFKNIYKSSKPDTWPQHYTLLTSPRNNHKSNEKKVVSGIIASALNMHSICSSLSGEHVLTLLLSTGFKHALTVRYRYLLQRQAHSQQSRWRLQQTDVGWHSSCCKPNRPHTRLRLGTQSCARDAVNVTEAAQRSLPPFRPSIVNIPADRFHFTVPFWTGNREECGLV